MGPADLGSPPLRLLFVSAARRWTGGERCVTAVSRGLVARGHAVVFAADPRGPVLERLDASVRVVPVRIRNDADVVALARLAALVRRHRPDAVCVNTFRELKLGGTAARLAGRAGVVNRMGTTDALYGGARERAVYRALLDVLVRDSEWGARRVRRENPWLACPVLLARNGVDADAIAAVRPASRADLGAEQDEVLVAVSGRGSVEHTPALLATLEDAVARGAAGSLPPLRLVFLGRRLPSAARAIASATDPRAVVRTTFLGDLPPEDALSALAACDLLARPSVTDGLSFAVLEAMALGLPVVAFAAGGLAEAVVDGATGRLAPPGEPHALAAALLDLIVNSALCRRMGQAAHERVRREFTERRMLDAYEAAFRLAARRGRVPAASRTIEKASAAARSQLK